MLYCLFFFFNDTATTEIYTLSLHDALPIWSQASAPKMGCMRTLSVSEWTGSSSGRRISIEKTSPLHQTDRKSTRLNSSHANISYAVFCLKKKTNSFKICDLTSVHPGHVIIW